MTLDFEPSDFSELCWELNLSLLPTVTVECMVCTPHDTLFNCDSVVMMCSFFSSFFLYSTFQRKFALTSPWKQQRVIRCSSELITVLSLLGDAMMSQSDSHNEDFRSKTHGNPRIFNTDPEFLFVRIRQSRRI